MLKRQPVPDAPSRFRRKVSANILAIFAAPPVLAPSSRLGERLLLDRIELGLRDRAAVEKLLRLCDLIGGR